MARIYIGKSKAGVTYRYKARISWDVKKYFTCDFVNDDPQYFPSLRLARENAERLGILSTTEDK